MSKPRIRVTTDGQVRVNDGFVNVAAQLGTARDKASGSSYVYVPLHAMQLLNVYRQSWLAKKIVNIPAHDATRRWRTWQADKAVVTTIEKAEKAFGLQRKVKAAQVAARLYGGAALYLSVKGQDPAEPLDLSRVNKGDLLGVDLFTRYQLTPDTMETDSTSAHWGMPKHFNIVGLNDQQTQKIHPSRLAIFQGEHVPTTANMEWVWGDPVLQSVLQTIGQHDGLVANAASLVFEANVDILHIPRLMELMNQPGGDEKVLTYLSTLARVKGNNGMLVLDGGDTSLPEGNTGGTKFDRKSINFAGLSDLWDRFMQVCSAAADIPVTRLFGRSAAGMNATGEGDQDNYDQAVASIQHNDIGPNIDALDECLLRSALGSRDEQIYYEWRGLSDPTDIERAEHAKAVADVLKIVSDMAVLPIETMQAVTVSALTETGALPGLEAAVDEHGLKLEDPLDDADLLTGALGEPARKPGADEEKRNDR